MALTERRYRRNWCMPFYRYPVRIVSASPGAACRSPTMVRLMICPIAVFPAVCYTISINQ